ncbi:MAG: hypothetical protein ACO2PN_16035 [Pyrobaculum sp.]|jgi:hypothetical protein
MDRNKIKERLELALRPAEPPTLEEVLEQVSTRGVLRGPVDWVFPAWMLYVEYTTQKIAETFQLSEEEKRQLLHFRDAIRRLLLEAWTQAKEKLTTLYKAVAEGTYRLEGNKLYATDSAYVLMDRTAHILIHGIGTPAYFPDVLKLPREKLKLLQLGWEASDETRHGKSKYAKMKTSRPWQVFAWAAVRFGKVFITTPTLNLARDGASILFSLISRWKIEVSKEEAVKRALTNPTSTLTMWLGDGVKSERSIRRRYAIMEVASRIPLSPVKTRNGTYVVGRRELIMQMLDAAQDYGRLLDALRSDKWLYLKVLAEALQNSRPPPVKITIAGTTFGLRLQSHGGCAVYAVFRTRNEDEARAVAAALEEMKIRYNKLYDGKYHMVYITTTELAKLAKDGIAEGLIRFLQLRKDKPCAKRLLNLLFSNYFELTRDPTSVDMEHRNQLEEGARLLRTFGSGEASVAGEGY